MLEFKLKDSVKVFEDKDEITLSVGVLENNIITIPKTGEGVEVDFLKILKSLINNQSVSIENDNMYFKDVMNIYNYGFLKVKKSNDDGKILLINLDESTDICLNDDIKIMYKSLHEILKDEEIDILVTKTNALKYKDIMDKAKNELLGYDSIFVFGGMCHLNKLLAINEILSKNFIKGIFFTYDTASCFVVGMDSEMGTGCFQCFLSNILNHKKISNSKYCSDVSYIEDDMRLFLLSIINSEINNMINHKESIIYGNVISYIPKLYQYTFDFNRRTVLCNSCIERFYDSFEEQNIAAINLIKNM